LNIVEKWGLKNKQTKLDGPSKKRDRENTCEMEIQ